MAKKHCPNCGCAVYALGCVNCDEDGYIDEQRAELGMPSIADAIAERERENQQEQPAHTERTA